MKKIPDDIYISRGKGGGVVKARVSQYRLYLGLRTESGLCEMAVFNVGIVTQDTGGCLEKRRLWGQL